MVRRRERRRPSHPVLMFRDMCIKLGGRFRKEWAFGYTCNFKDMRITISRPELEPGYRVEWDEAYVYIDVDLENRELFRFKEADEIVRLIEETPAVRKISGYVEKRAPKVVQLELQEVDLTNPDIMRQLFEIMKSFKETVRKVEKKYG
ncbi:MAG: hypothetical protein DRP01_00635 [Archaeoglobales archaeon]|nr:MAG: hypothetical protein DRP01_00635 [Archaeoglobales archaeon]